MSERTRYGNLQVSQELDNFLRNEVVPGIDVDTNEFWKSFEKIDFSKSFNGFGKFKSSWC